jgi:cytosine/adenosine deaminase-related metal-dependent hydrolase
MDPQNRVIEDGAVAIKGNAIAAVGTSDAIRQAYTAERTLDAQHKVVMPGLIDTYGHAGHGLIKGIYSPELGWPSGKLYFHATDEHWWHAEGMLSALERLKFGVTCGFTVVGATPARMDSPVFAERQAEAVEAVGTRGVLGVGPPDPYVSHLPEPWHSTAWEDGEPVKKPFTFAETVQNTVTVIEKWHGGAEGRVQVAIHYPYLFGRLASHPRMPFEYKDSYVPTMIEKAEEMRELADRHGVLLHTHAFVGSVAYGLEKYGRERVHRLLGPDVIFAHSNGLEEEEIQVLGEEGVGIAVVPFTHENILYGPCPVIELLQAGATVTISTDGTAPYCSYDLFKDVPRAVWTQWERFKDQTLLPPGKALRMVTIDAAKALGLDDMIGSLEPGKRADVIVLDFDQPHLTPHAFVPRQLVFYATGHDVETVLVDGQVLMEERQVRSVDAQAVVEQAREQAELAFERVNITDYVAMDENFWKNWKY